MVLNQEEIDSCREAFIVFDKDRSGTIDVWELRQVLDFPLISISFSASLGWFYIDPIGEIILHFLYVFIYLGLYWKLWDSGQQKKNCSR